MTWIRRMHDTMWAGTFIGTLFLFVFYGLFSGIRFLLVQYLENPYVLLPPRIHLFTLGANVLLFRFTMVRFQKEKTGKGILLITVVAAFLYFFIEQRIWRGEMN